MLPMQQDLKTWKMDNHVFTLQYGLIQAYYWRNRKRGTIYFEGWLNALSNFLFVHWSFLMSYWYWGGLFPSNFLLFTDLVRIATIPLTQWLQQTLTW
jgi:hypothetical protein